LAALSVHGAVPPARAGLAGQPQARERLEVDRLEGQLADRGEVERRDRHVDALGVVQRVGDRTRMSG
jgi:hypothetical protein